jgi:hypothetical protein
MPRSGAAHETATEKRLKVAQNQTWGAASIGADVEMVSLGRFVNLFPFIAHIASLHTHVTIQPLVKGRAAQHTRARHRTHASKHAAMAIGTAAGAGVVRRSAGRRWKVARWRADMHSAHHHGTRGRVVCGVLGELRREAQGASPTPSTRHPHTSNLSGRARGRR